MKIDSDQLLSTVNKFRNEQPEKVEPSVVNGKKNGASGPGSDRVEISSQMAQLEQLKSSMQGISDVRTEKVARLKEAIEAGTYRVDGSQIAAKMLERWKEINGQ